MVFASWKKRKKKKMKVNEIFEEKNIRMFRKKNSR